MDRFLCFDKHSSTCNLADQTCGAQHVRSEQNVFYKCKYPQTGVVHGCMSCCAGRVTLVLTEVQSLKKISGDLVSDVTETWAERSEVARLENEHCDCLHSNVVCNILVSCFVR